MYQPRSDFHPDHRNEPPSVPSCESSKVDELSPPLLFLENKSFGKDHVSIVIEDDIQAEEVVVVFLGAVDVANYEEEVFEFHG